MDVFGYGHTTFHVINFKPPPLHGMKIPPVWATTRKVILFCNISLVVETSLWRNGTLVLHHVKYFLSKQTTKITFYAPLKKGVYCFATVGWSVGVSVCRPSVVRSLSFDPFTWSIPNLVQGLPSASRWSLLIFRSHVQRPRSNHSSQPSVLSNLYILIPCLLTSNSFCFYRKDKPKFCTMGGICVSETFLVIDRLYLYSIWLISA